MEVYHNRVRKWMTSVRQAERVFKRLEAGMGSNTLDQMQILLVKYKYTDLVKYKYKYIWSNTNTSTQIHKRMFKYKVF